MDCWWNNSTRFIPTENNLWQRSDWAQSYCMLLYLCPKHAYWDNWLFNAFLVKCCFFFFFVISWRHLCMQKTWSCCVPCCLIQDGMKNMLWNILDTNCQCFKQKGLCIQTQIKCNYKVYLGQSEHPDGLCGFGVRQLSSLSGRNLVCPKLSGNEKTPTGGFKITTVLSKYSVFLVWADTFMCLKGWQRALLYKKKKKNDNKWRYKVFTRKQSHKVINHTFLSLVILPQSRLAFLCLRCARGLTFPLTAN